MVTDKQPVKDGEAAAQAQSCLPGGDMRPLSPLATESEPPTGCLAMGNPGLLGTAGQTWEAMEGAVTSAVLGFNCKVPGQKGRRGLLCLQAFPVSLQAHLSVCLPPPPSPCLN